MRILSLALLATFTASAHAQVLIGATTPSGGNSSIVEINPATGALRVIMSVPVPAGYEVYNMAALPPCRLAGAIQNVSTANNVSWFMKIDPATNKGRPPTCTFEWGNAWSFEAVVTSINTSFTMFLGDG